MAEAIDWQALARPFNEASGMRKVACSWCGEIGYVTYGGAKPLFWLGSHDQEGNVTMFCEKCCKTLDPDWSIRHEQAKAGWRG